MLSAEQHKLKGNDYFKSKAYDDAIQEYTTAIVKDPKIAVYYCNRANCFLKLERFSKVVSDCERVVELDVKSAYELALDQRSSFTKDIVQITSEAKKQRWIERERRLISEVSETYRYLSDLIHKDIKRQMDAIDPSSSDYDDELAYLRSDQETRLVQLETMMQRAVMPDEYAKPYVAHKDSLRTGGTTTTTTTTTKESKGHPPLASSTAIFVPREVPDHFLDKITFELMHDPVISIKSGISYERSALLDHFSYGRMFDPVAQ
ncbi:STIP1 y and U box-containing protein 1, partial [Lunasporangiospora selenospora]